MPSASSNTLRRVLGKNRTGALSAMKVSGDTSGTLDQIFDQNEITDILMQHIHMHFKQAHGTSCTVPILPPVEWHGRPFGVG
jgi:hypothetical protein